MPTRHLAIGLVRDPVLIVAMLILGVGLAAILMLRAVFSIMAGMRSLRSRAPDRSDPALEHLVGRPVAVSPGANIGDDLFARRLPSLESR